MAQKSLLSSVLRFLLVVGALLLPGETRARGEFFGAAVSGATSSVVSEVRTESRVAVCSRSWAGWERDGVAPPDSVSPPLPQVWALSASRASRTGEIVGGQESAHEFSFSREGTPTSRRWLNGSGPRPPPV